MKILNVIDVKPVDFWGDVFQFSEAYQPRQKKRVRRAPVAGELQRIERLYDGIVGVRLIQAANALGGHDNTTVVLVQIEE